MANPFTTALIVVYALLTLSLGLIFIRRQDGPEMFFLADRSLGPLAVLGTMLPTFLGTGLLFTLAAFGYQYGVGAFLLPGAAAIGFILFAWATPKIKAVSDEEGAITFPALFGATWSGRTRFLAALITASLFAGTLAANLVAAGTVLNALLNVPLRLGILASGVLIISYTVLGGFSSVVWTDVLQLVLIVGAFGLILPGFILLQLDPGVVGGLPAGHLNPLSLPTGVLVAYLFIGVFAFFGSQDLFQRVYAARGGDEARRGVLLFAGLLVLMAIVAVALGVLTRAIRPDIQPDHALLALTETVVPAGLGGIVLLGFLALANSDADSQLLTVTSNVTQDLLPHFGLIPAERPSVSIERITTVGVGGLALLTAVGVPNLTTLFSALGSWFAMLGVIMIATMFWSRMTDTAAFAGLGFGFLAPIVFVAVTGSTQPAMMVGLATTVLAVGVAAFLTSESG